MEFQAFPKIPRLNRDITITEKIDGTNAAVLIEVLTNTQSWDGRGTPIEVDGVVYTVGAQSRKRLITPESDNFGFARWVRDNVEELVRLMGPGRHFGEWWGLGIQRGYGQDVKRFSVFNPTFRWGLPIDQSPLLRAHYVDTVPVLYEGEFRTAAVNNVLLSLSFTGSQAAPGFMRPEGVIVWHEAARQAFKATLENDEAPKGQVNG
jgi:hypothetical protein